MATLLPARVDFCAYGAVSGIGRARRRVRRFPLEDAKRGGLVEEVMIRKCAVVSCVETVLGECHGYSSN